MRHMTLAICAAMLFVSTVASAQDEAVRVGSEARPAARASIRSSLNGRPLAQAPRGRAAIWDRLTEVQLGCGNGTTHSVLADRVDQVNRMVPPELSEAEAASALEDIVLYETLASVYEIEAVLGALAKRGRFAALETLFDAAPELAAKRSYPERWMDRAVTDVERRGMMQTTVGHLQLAVVSAAALTHTPSARALIEHLLTLVTHSRTQAQIRAVLDRW